MTRQLVVDNTEHTGQLRGSWRADDFKFGHKGMKGKVQHPGAVGLWAADIDLVLVSKAPPYVVAVLDVKGFDEPVSFTEVILYGALMRIAPVYLVWTEHPLAGPFVIEQYLGGDWRPSPPVTRTRPEASCDDWEAFWEWEARLRAARAREVREW